MQEFLGQLSTALQTNDVMFLFNNLHPANINLYSPSTCQTHLKERSPDPTYNIEFVSMTGPAAWVYAPPGQPQVPVINVYTINANITEQGKTGAAQLHIGQVGDHLYWFTACD